MDTAKGSHGCNGHEPPLAKWKVEQHHYQHQHQKGAKGAKGAFSAVAALPLIALALCLSSTQAQFVAHLNIPSANKCKFRHGKHTHIRTHRHMDIDKDYCSFCCRRCTFPERQSAALFCPALSTYLYKFSIFCFNSPPELLLLFTLFMSQEFNIFSNYSCCFPRTCFVVQLWLVGSGWICMALLPKDW